MIQTIKRLFPIRTAMTLLVLMIAAATAWATQPDRYLDVCTGGEGIIHIQGWAYDPDASEQSIDVHVYVYTDEGCTNQYGDIHVLTANVSRPDVNEAKNITGDHGFSTDIIIADAGNYWVKVFAIDTNGDSNPQIGSTKAVSVTASYINLTTLWGDYTVVADATLSGTTNHTISIADNVNVTLSNATINGGIVCNGSAEITLDGTNIVKGINYQSAGIQVGGSGTTLTIKGDGSLTATGGQQSAGIGLSRAWNPANDVIIGGDIVIEGGNITANGGSQWGAGIGTGVICGNGSAKTVRLGNITIKGGTVKSNGGSEANGIGTGYCYGGCTNEIGAVTVYDAIDMVDASSIKGSVTYMHGETDVTASASNYFNIIEEGSRRIIYTKDDTYYTITIADGIEHGTVTADKTTAKAGEYVTLTITHDAGYGLSSVTVTDSEGNPVEVSDTQFLMPMNHVTVNAFFVKATAVCNEVTHVLTLNGNVVASDVKAYAAILDPNHGIVEESPVTSVVCEEGTVLPADCSELFKLFNNVITIDLSNADVSHMTNTTRMFSMCPNLTTIYVSSSWSMANVTSSDYMFEYCDHLFGGDYTSARVTQQDDNYNPDYTHGSAYAIIDNGTGGNPGFLTGVFSLTLPAQMEIATDAPSNKIINGKYVQGSHIFIKAKEGYTVININATGTTAYYYTDGTYHISFITDDVVVTATFMMTVTFADDADNTTAISDAASFGEPCNIRLGGRTLYRDGDWNTLTVPFAVSSFDGTPFEGATVKTLSSAAFSNGTLTLNFEDATEIEAGKPYIVKWDDGANVTINSTDDWNVFAEAVNGGKSYAGKTVLLGADIDVSTMVGTADCPFSGTFEGAGHTLNISISDGGDGAAPFHYISGATIRNVKTTGMVSGGNHCASIVGIAMGGTNSIRDCHISASVSGGSYAGGILGSGTTSSTTISNSLFDGSLTAFNMGILYGWGEDGGTHTVENCVASGTYGTYANGSIDLLLGEGTKTVTNCWKNTDAGSQGDNGLVIYMGGEHPLVSGNLGSQWTYDNGFVLNPTVSVLDTNIENPVFLGVTVDATPSPVLTTWVDFVGTYEPMSFIEADKSILFLGTANTLYYPVSGAYIGAQRAYFHLKGIESGDPTSPNSVRAFALNFGDDGNATGILNVTAAPSASSDAWYTLDGLKLNAKPTARGIYINNGRKIVIK